MPNFLLTGPYGGEHLFVKMQRSEMQINERRSMVPSVATCYTFVRTLNEARTDINTSPKQIFPFPIT